MDLAPFHPPLGPQPPNGKFYSPYPITLVMKEKVFTLHSDDFHVKTPEGHSICKCKGKVFSIHDKKKFTDMEDNEIFTLCHKLLHIPTSFRGESPQGFNFDVKGHIKLIGSRSTITFKNASDEQEIELEVKGSWLDRKAEIKLGDRPVATITREFFNVRQFIGDSQTYYVHVAPNVDLTLVAAICVAVDERETEKR